MLPKDGYREPGRPPFATSAGERKKGPFSIGGKEDSLLSRKKNEPNICKKTRKVAD